MSRLLCTPFYYDLFSRVSDFITKDWIEKYEDRSNYMDIKDRHKSYVQEIVRELCSWIEYPRLRRESLYQFKMLGFNNLQIIELLGILDETKQGYHIHEGDVALGLKPCPRGCSR